MRTEMTDKITPYHIGFAEVGIAPASDAKATGVSASPRAIAVVFDDRSGNKSLICAVDIDALPAWLARDVRLRVRERIGAASERIMLVTTRTGFAPNLEADTPDELEYSRFLADRMVEAGRPYRVAAALDA